MRDESIRQYDGFAQDYHWLYSDYALSGKPALEENEDVLAAAGPPARILDCSCGIGTLAIALARLGYEVAGSDASPGMVEQAAQAANNAGLNIPLRCCRWEELRGQFTARFDLVFCIGNSIGHARNREEMVRSLAGMRAVLGEGGRLVIQSRNWERLRQEKTRFTHFPWRERAGERCLPLYVWSFPEEFGGAHTIEVVLIFDGGGQASIRSYPIVYYPFRSEELMDCLRRAGFSGIGSGFRDSAAEYRVIAW